MYSVRSMCNYEEAKPPAQSLFRVYCNKGSCGPHFSLDEEMYLYKTDLSPKSKVTQLGPDETRHVPLFQ